jgi:hypothetical protein
MAGGSCDQRNHGGIHPHPVGDCNYCGAPQNHSGETDSLNKFFMESKAIIAILFIIFGVVVLAYSGITYTTPRETVSFFGLLIETREAHYIPPIAGVISLLAGIVLLLIKPRAI